MKKVFKGTYWRVDISKMMKWEESLEKAKEEKEIYDYVDEEEWEEVLDRAREIQEEYNERIWDEELEFLSEKGKEEYHKYLRSYEWEDKRKKFLKWKKHKCEDCGGLATEAHHKTYVNLGTVWEMFDLVPICRNCHQKRHNRR